MPNSPKPPTHLLALATLLAFAAVSTAQRPERPPRRDRLLVCNRADDSLSVLSPAERRDLLVIPVAAHPVEVAVSPDGLIAAVASTGRNAGAAMLTVVDVLATTVQGTVALPSPPTALRFLDGRRVLVCARGGRVHRVDISLGEVERTFDPAAATWAAVRPHTSERWLLASDRDTLSVIDTSGNRLAAPIHTGRHPHCIAFTPDGSLAALTCTADGLLLLFDAGRRRLLAEVSLQGDRSEQSPLPLGVACGADGRFAYVVCARGEYVAIVDLERRDYVDRIDARRSPCGIAYARPIRR